MKKACFLICIICLFGCPLIALAASPLPPMNLGGFTLGKDIKDYEDRLEIEQCQEIRYQEYLGEGVLKPVPGFKSGSVAYGLCDNVNKILRIKLKFLDSSKDFFKTLLKKYESRLGPAEEYQGDPFQTFIAWKWSFESDNGQRISLILQHNLTDVTGKMGNAVKLTLMDQIDKEKACYETRYPEKAAPAPEQALTGKAMWDMYIPF